jgi:uncharacterized protein YlxP (DUF503 family)
MSTRDDIAAHIDYFGELGVTGVSKDRAWTDREAQTVAVVAPAAESEPALTAGLAEIRMEIGDCTRC